MALRILCYSRHFFPSIGGVEISSRIFASELAKLGHEVTIATHTALPKGVEEPEAEYSIIRMPSFKDLIAYSKQHDVIIIRGGIATNVAIAALLARRVLIVVHEVGPSIRSWNKLDIVGLKKGFKETAKLLLYPFIRLHLGVSQTILKQKTLSSRSKSVCIYNPVRSELWADNSLDFAARTIDIAFIGRVIGPKGVFTFLEAIERLDVFSNLRVVMVGIGEAEQQVRATIQDRKLNIDLLGALSGPELHEIYRSTKVVVVPSIANEGMGMTIAEAFASGTPVCASNQPALREVASTAALFHAPGNADELAQTIDRLLADPILWSTLSENALSIREIYSVDAYRSTLASVCDKIEVLRVWGIFGRN